MKEMMMLAGVHIARRYKTKEKELFLQQVIELTDKKGLKHSFQTKHSKIMNVCNLVIGDLDHAQVIVACAYDTPAKAVLPGFKYYPFNPSFNKKEETKNLACQLLGLFLCFFLIFLYFRNFNEVQMWLKILIVAAAVITGYHGFRFLKPHGNKMNFSRNSVSVALILKLMQTVQSNKTAYVFLDQNCASYEGAKLLKEHCKNHQLVILLDNLASGDKTVVAHKKKIDVNSFLKENWIDKQYDETDNMLSLFERSLIISCGTIKNKKFFVENSGTRKDYGVDMNRLNQIYNILKNNLEELV